MVYRQPERLLGPSQAKWRYPVLPRSSQLGQCPQPQGTFVCGVHTLRIAELTSIQYAGFVNDKVRSTRGLMLGIEIGIRIWRTLYRGKC